MSNDEHTSMALDVFKELFEGKKDTNQEITERFKKYLFSSSVPNETLI